MYREHFKAESKVRRRTEHEERVTKWQNMGPELQTAELNMRLGLGQGAKKQRAKIDKLLGRKYEEDTNTESVVS